MDLASPPKKPDGSSNKNTNHQFMDLGCIHPDIIEKIPIFCSSFDPNSPSVQDAAAVGADGSSGDFTNAEKPGPGSASFCFHGGSSCFFSFCSLSKSITRADMQ